MTFEEIERVLGEVVVADVQAAVQSAFVAAHVAARNTRPVEDLLIGMLVAAIVTPDTYATSGPRVNECALRLIELGEATRKLYLSGSDRPLN